MTKTTRTGPEPPEPTQIDKFREAARELGCDESEKRFRAVVRKVAKAPYTKHAAKGGNPKSPEKNNAR